MDTLSPALTVSYSKLKSFEDCPRRYYETSVLKNYKEDKSELQAWGDAVHQAMAKALRGDAPLPAMFHIYQKWIDKVQRMGGELMVEDECRLAINRNKLPTEWFAPDVWF